MISYTRDFLDNGLELIVHTDKSSPVICMNILYKVGSRNENPNKTGFAHLFEHLMFGGSENIGNFDEPLQKVGGDNNAFTSPDITNYYVTLPAKNIETAFWLESDRMKSLSFDPNVLEVQRKVVIEEFKQRYLNQPYGDVWLKLRPAAYTVHPYRWATIGKEISHIEEATMGDVKSFFGKFYHPGNAILVLAGDIDHEQALLLTKKWFGPLEGKVMGDISVPVEPRQETERKLEVMAEFDVPADALYKAYHMVGRGHEDYPAVDLLSDYLGRGKSSVLYQKLVRDEPVFTSISSYVTGSADPGLLAISGKPSQGVSLEEADAAIGDLLQEIKNKGIPERDLQKVKNQAEATSIYSEVDLLNRAMGLAYASFLGDPNKVNEEIDKIRAITKEKVDDIARATLVPENTTTMYYRKKQG